MIVRYLLAFLALVTIAIQSCGAAGVDDGTYIISLIDNGFLTAKHEIGAPVELLPPLLPPGLQQWRVERQIQKGTLIIHLGITPDQLYLAPKDTKTLSNHEELVLSPKPFYWDLYRLQDDSVVGYVHQDFAPVAYLLGLSPSNVEPPHADIQEFQPEYAHQKWTFRRLDAFKQETRMRSGPWRIQEEWGCTL
jgi:hypothetical protein